MVLQGHLSPFVRKALSGVSTYEIDLSDRIIFVHPRFLVELFSRLTSTSRLVAWISALIKCTGAQAVVTMDNFDIGRHNSSGTTLLEEVGESLLNISIFSIQHGQELKRFHLGRPQKRVTLLCWGSWVADNFPRFGRNEQRFVPVGPLVDGLYRAIRPKNLPKNNRLCFISTIKGHEWWGDRIGERRQGFEILTTYLRKYSERHQIVPNIALTIDRDQNDVDEYPLERKWFTDRLGENIIFAEPKHIFGSADLADANYRIPEYVKERYSTYALCDRSIITLGMASSALWESFGRGNKILAVNCTDNDVYDFPVPGIWSMRQPTYDAFETRMNELTAMSDQDWELVSRDARQYLIHYDSESPPHVAINREIRRALH